jgi:hypothetical protein
MNVNGLASNGHFVQQEIPAARTSTSLARVLGPTRRRCPSRTSGTLDLCSSGRHYGHIDGTLRRGHRLKQSLHFGVPSTSGISRVRRNAADIIFLVVMRAQRLFSL